MTSLGLDIDGVLYDWHSSVLAYLTLYKGYTGTYNKLWSEDYKEFSEDYWNYLASIDTLYSSCLPTTDCINFISWAKDRYEIYYITSRPPLVRLTTEQYFSRYNFPYLDNIIFESDKVNTARLLKLQYFIEDLPASILPLSKVTNIIVKAQPYNIDLWEMFPTTQSLMGAIKFMSN